MSDIIEAKNLIKKYGGFTAVDGISFTVKDGETFGILGPNGAGKTTTLEMVEGLKPITSGQVLLDGHDVAKQPYVIKSLIGVQLQSSSFFDGLNLKELVETFASLYNRKVNSLALLKSVQLDEKANNRVKELSGGQKQRLSIAVALVNNPKVLFLDEPTTGLDPQARRNLWELITKISEQGKTVVLTTHYMDEAETLCDRIAIMDHAKIAALDTTSRLLQNAGVDSTIKFAVNKPLPLESIRRLPAVTTASHFEKEYHLISSDPESTLPALFRLAQETIGFRLSSLQLRQPTLEDVFLKLTGHELRE